MASEEVLYIEGGHRLRGEAVVQGSKNAALPMLAASLLAERGQTVLRRVPPVKDVLVGLEVLRRLGAVVDYDPVDEVAVIDASGEIGTDLPDELTERFRASILFVGPLLGRFLHARIKGVGGCSIGQRPWDYHERGFARLNAQVRGVGGGGLEISAEQPLQGGFTYCDVPSHTGVENLIMAASLARGESVIENAASDPEIVDFVRLLTKMGAKVEGAGTRTVRITGVDRLQGAEHTVMHDRLDAGMLMMACAMAGGEVALKGVNIDHLRVFEAKLQQMGVETIEDGDWLRVRGPEWLSPINVVTTFYPGFPTDLQPSIMALALCGQRGQFHSGDGFRGSLRSRKESAFLRRQPVSGKGQADHRPGTCPAQGSQGQGSRHSRRGGLCTRGSGCPGTDKCTQSLPTGPWTRASGRPSPRAGSEIGETVGLAGVRSPHSSGSFPV